MTERITTKEHMYRLLMNGRFGNYVRSWRTIADIQLSGYTGHVSLRSLEINNPVRLYHVPMELLVTTIFELPDSQKHAGLMFSESPDDTYRLIQGEYDGINFTYSFINAPMRLAFDQQRLHANRLQAHWLLKAHMTAGDRDWLEQLLVDFPNSTVEFSCFKRPIGTVPGSQTIFWEVRHY